MFDELIKADIDFILQNANFNTEQRLVFDWLIKGDYPDYRIMQEINMTESKFYKIKKQVKNKIKRIL